MATFKDSIGNEHYCDDRVEGMLKELKEVGNHADIIADCMNRFMSATHDVVDLSEEKGLIERAVKGMCHKYGERVLETFNQR